MYNHSEKKKFLIAHHHKSWTLIHCFALKVKIKLRLDFIQDATWNLCTIFKDTEKWKEKKLDPVFLTVKLVHGNLEKNEFNIAYFTIIKIIYVIHYYISIFTLSADRINYLFYLTYNPQLETLCQSVFVTVLQKSEPLLFLAAIRK